MQKQTEEIKSVSYNGLRFCPKCSNLLIPDDGKESNKLIYKCRMHNEVVVTLTKGKEEDHLIKQIILRRGKAADIYDKDMPLDPTMPRKKIECPRCQYHEAVYYLKSDNDEKKMLT